MTDNNCLSHNFLPFMFLNFQLNNFELGTAQPQLVLKLCHRDFSPQSNVKNHNFINRKVYQLFDKLMIFNITL